MPMQEWGAERQEEKKTARSRIENGGAEERQRNSERGGAGNEYNN
jgi:hypothetical protein